MNALPVFTPRDAAELNGIPHHISYEEQNIGETVSISKKKIEWRFVLGESDQPHLISLTHSVLSAKKLVELDGREVFFTSTMTPGDWFFMMILESSNHMVEVRISESDPKYDLLIDRVSYRRWDVYRRKGRQNTSYINNFNTYGSNPSNRKQGSTSNNVWGPTGMTTKQPQQQQQQQQQHNIRGGTQHDSNRRNSPPLASGNRYNPNNLNVASSGPVSSSTQSRNFERKDSYASNRRKSLARQNSLQKDEKPKVVVQKQKEINLMDDFGHSESPTQSMNALYFDPLVNPSGVSTNSNPPTSNDNELSGNSNPLLSDLAGLSFNNMESADNKASTTKALNDSDVSNRTCQLGNATSNSTQSSIIANNVVPDPFAHVSNNSYARNDCASNNTPPPAPSIQNQKNVVGNHQWNTRPPQAVQSNPNPSSMNGSLNITNLLDPFQVDRSKSTTQSKPNININAFDFK